MHTKRPVYKPGELLLDWFDKFQDKSVSPGIVPVARVEGTSAFFYYLFVPVFLQGIRRKSLEAVEAWSMCLPSDLQCRFPAGFSVFRLVSRFAYLSMLWCIDEFSKFHSSKTGGNGHSLASQVGADAGLRGCGYALREIRKDLPVRWTWATSAAGVISALRTWAKATEADEPLIPSLPDVLVEARLHPWEPFSALEAHNQFRSGDAFCTLQSGVWTFHTFAELSKSGRVITSNGEFLKRTPVCDLPSAFPKEILALLHSIHHCCLLPGCELWVACADPVRVTPTSDEYQLPDLPNNAMTIPATKALQLGQFGLYYTSDLIHWRHRLSAVLQEMLPQKNLVPSHAGVIHP